MSRRRQKARGQPRRGNRDKTPSPTAGCGARRGLWATAALIVAAGLIAYANCYRGKFVYDGVDAVQRNTCIRTLWPLSQAMSLPMTTTGTTVDGRPVLSLSFAINYALFDDSLAAYHAVNVAIHICAALLLFGIVRRTVDRCQQDAVEPTSLRHATRDTRRALGIAAAVALLWVVHPLQTESVTYLAQRAESLMGLFYLLTLYAAMRGFGGQIADFKSQISDAATPPNEPHPDTRLPRRSRQAKTGHVTGDTRLATREMRHPPAAAKPTGEDRTPDTRHPAPGIPEAKTECRHARRLWFALSVLACALGMGTKEVMISAPLAVLAYDCVFVCGSLRGIARRRWRLYAGLAATWGVTALLLARGGLSNIGEDYASRSALWYALTQPRIILHYLRLTVWPHPLAMDYHWPTVSNVAQMIPEGILVAALLALTGWGLSKRRAFGFAGLCFFFVLAPTSSFFPTSQTCHEHRMYLPLAVVLVLLVMAAERVLRRISANPHARAVAASLIMLVLATAFTARTLSRNRDYHDVAGFWARNSVDRPGSPVAQTNVGVAMYKAARRTGDTGYYEQAIGRFRAALDSAPRHYSALNHWGVVLFDLGKTAEAMKMYERALDIRPDYDAALDNMGNAHARLGQYDQAIACYGKALESAPRSASVHSNLGGAYLRLRQTEKAIPCFRTALKHDPDNVEALNNLGTALHRQGRSEEGLECYRRSLALKPSRAKTHRNMALILGGMGRFAQAIESCRRANALQPDSATTLLLLGQLYRYNGQAVQAVPHLRRALALAEAAQNAPLAAEIKELLNKTTIP